METLDVRLMGRFEVRMGDRLVRGFESRKVRILFAYLAIGDAQPEPTRARVAALLWPDLPEPAGRRNLRQALYNIRRCLQEAGVPGDAVVEDSDAALTLARSLDITVDVLTFERLMTRGLNEGGRPDNEALSRALAIYRGDFLDGLYLEEGLAFEEWLLLRRERLRDLAIDGYRSLTSYSQERGEYARAVQSARRWVGLDPLAEEGHRTLMELYVRSGRRSRALAQYETCAGLLRVELGVDPMPETTRLLESILAEEADESGTVRPLPDARPGVPLVGRREAYGALRESWEKVGPNGGRLALLQGEAGVGKTRLVKTLVHGFGSTDHACVLLGRSFRGGVLPAVLGGVADVFRSARACEPDTLAAVLAEDGELDAYVKLLLDEGSGVASAATSGDGSWNGLGPGGALVRLMRHWVERCRRVRTDEPRVILLFENLQWASASTIAALRELAAELAELPVWVVATLDPTVKALPLEDLRDEPAQDRTDLITLGRLDDRALLEIGGLVASTEEARELGSFVLAHSAGLPLTAAELVNLLCDEGALVNGEGGWRLNRRLDSLAASGTAGLDHVFAKRIDALHSSARRTAVAAALTGQTFDLSLLGGVLDEPMEVLEPVTHTLLQRGILRFLPARWFESRRERDLVLWREGTRRGLFQVSSRRLGDALMRVIPPARRAALHLRIADVLESSGPQSLYTGYAEAVAGHLLAAGESPRALPWVARVCERALALGAHASALEAGALGLGLIDQGGRSDQRSTDLFQRALRSGGAALPRGSR